MQDVSENLTYADVDHDVQAALRPPRGIYYLVMLILGCGVLAACGAWIYQVQTGMGVTGLSIPVAWAVYITNFVFWVGIGHAGTLISAILHLVRSRWRTAVSRSAEAMTIFAVMTAGLFPLIHLGRLWVFYYIIPYPSERQLWPNFTSPLVWDVVAVTTYLTVSIIFWYVGLIPDAAAARDRNLRELGPDHPRTRFYRSLALGWTGSLRQWHHYGRAYLFFAALATPLVISVHSVVSWDFAMSNLPGWHTTIFAPYFVAGAIHSGLAMVLTLLIPMRSLLHLERLITIKHFEAAAKTILVTTAIVGYAYLVEPFISWYSGDMFESQFAVWRATGWIAPFFWALTVLNVLAPLVLIFRRARQSLKALFIVGLLINVGMWLERWVIIVGSESHDFMPHNWHTYFPRWPEITITLGAFSFFLFAFFAFAKLFPTVAASDVKELVADLGHDEPAAPRSSIGSPRKADTGGALAVYDSAQRLIEALQAVREAGVKRLEAYSPIKLEQASSLLYRGSPVRLWTLCGAIIGCVSGFALAIGASAVNNLVVGGKFTPVAYIPYCIVAFEGTVLIGTLANLTGLFVHCRLGRKALPRSYDRRFSADRFGIFIPCAADELDKVQSLLRRSGAQEVHVVQ